MQSQRLCLDGLVYAAENVMPPAAVRADPLAALTQHQAIEQKMCDLLEVIADALPDNVLLPAAHTSVTILSSYVIDLFNLEETLFSLIEAKGRLRRELEEALGLARTEHKTDEAVAIELAAALEELIEPTRQRPGSREALGYLIRCYVASRRRHFAWEQLLIIKQARQLLSEDEQRVLANMILRHREGALHGPAHPGHSASSA